MVQSGSANAAASSSSSVTGSGSANQRFAFDVVTRLKRISLAAKNSSDFLLWKHRLNGAISWSRAQLGKDEEEARRRRRVKNGKVGDGDRVS